MAESDAFSSSTDTPNSQDKRESQLDARQRSVSHQERLAELAIHQVEGVGPLLRKRLLERFGNLVEATRATPQQLRTISGFGPNLIANWKKRLRAFDADSFDNECRETGIEWVTIAEERYPELLRETDDAPSVLFYRGDLRSADQIAIAIVGTRRATSYGKRQAERFAIGLSEAGFTIVSGLARGIDAVAHQAALAVEGRTLAVLGSGLNQIYPPEHDVLAAEIVERGAVISELHPQSRPKSGSFPRRNRIISGMSLAVVIVEAATRSGAMITARLANEQNREVFAIPGRVDELNARGCHALIRDGAKLVESIDDIIEELGPLAQPCETTHGQRIHQPRELTLSDQEQAVLKCLDLESLTIDELVAASNLPIHRVLATLSVLEMKRLIQRLEGNRVTRRTVR